LVLRLYFEGCLDLFHKDYLGIYPGGLRETMAFTGDLEHLPIVDIIQLVHTTRKSGIFSIKANNAESQIVFRNGSIVSANHIDNRVRIGSVLVKTGVITVDNLKQAMAAMKQADKNRLPLLATLVQMGTLKREDAVRGLKKLVEMTIVELMSWTKGTFTFDTDAVVVSTDGDQDLEVDAQMVLMDALRILDERERDRAAGKDVPSLEELYGDVVPEENPVEAKAEPSVLTADDLGLADLDRLEKKIPRPVSEMEIFDPAAIHRQKIQELLPEFSSEDQEAVLSFLRKSAGRKTAPGIAAKQAGKAVVLFSNDTLISHSVVSLCSDEGLLVYATDDATELDGMVSRCLLSARMPVVVFDSPAKSEGRFSQESIAGLRSQVSRKYSTVPVVQFAVPQQTDFILQSYADGVRAVFPKPSKEDRRETFIRDAIQFLDAFRSYVRNFQYGQDDADIYGRKLKDGILSLSRITAPSDVALVVLTAVSDMFERAVTLVMRGSELIGERAIGITSEKSLGPTPADRLRIALDKPSVFRQAIEKGRVYYGENSDETLRAFFREIGLPASPAVLLLPLISDQKVVAVVYGDFGRRAASPVRLDMLEILALQAGIVLEYAVFRRQVARAAQKP
jgi:DNA-binding NarL/FixJ family response regulator